MQIGQDAVDADADAHVEERTATMRATIPDNGKCPDRRVHQEIYDLVQVGGDQSANILANIMIVDAAQLLHFKAVLGVTKRGSNMSKRHATPNVVNRQEEAYVIWDVDCVHLIVFIKLEELHRVTLQSNLLLYFLADPLQVHVVVFLVLVIDLINASQDLIVIAVK